MRFYNSARPNMALLRLTPKQRLSTAASPFSGVHVKKGGLLKTEELNI